MSLIEDAKKIRIRKRLNSLYSHNYKRMYRVAISMLHNEEDAADAIQETIFLNAGKNWTTEK